MAGSICGSARITGSGRAVHLLEARAVSKSFGSLRALDRASLTVGFSEIHAVVGENGAGKTTLMHILYGATRPDDGEIIFGGRRVQLSSPRDARRLGIGMVHQELALVEPMTVLENLAPALAPGRWRFDREFVARAARRVAGEVGLELPPLDRRVAELPVGVRQRLEILKAMAGHTRLLILDEPTATLTPAEAQNLFALLRRLRESGASVLFISHKLPEVLAIADRITVLRAGRVVASCPRGEVDEALLARLMIGEAAPREQTLRRKPRQAEVVAELSGLAVNGTDGRPTLKPLDLSLCAGEVFGIAGVDGNGQNELYEVLVGLRAPSAGVVAVDGSALPPASPAAAIEKGVATIPPDRRRLGLALEMSVWENLLLNRSLLRRQCPRWWLSPQRARSWAAQAVKRHGIRAPGIDAPAAQLSGGNQQRLVAARALSLSPRVLVAFNPTRGLDIAGSAAMYDAFGQVLARGGGILLISSDLDEVLRLSDRVRVLFRGRASEIFERPFPIERIAERMGGVGLEGVGAA